MEDLKKCPAYGKEIKAAAKKCRFCGKWFDENVNGESVNGQTDSNRQKKEDSNLEKYGIAINFGEEVTLKEALVEPFKMTFRTSVGCC